MTNNLEDFEQPDPGQGGNLPPAQSTRAKLAHAWRTKPLFKLMVLMIVVGSIIAVSIGLFSSPPPTTNSKLATPPAMHEPPGGPASPYFLEQTKKAQQERERVAMTTGGSVLPTPIGQNAGIDEMSANEGPKKDPLVELRSEILHQQQEISQMKQQAQQPQQPAQAPKAPEQFDNTLAQAMQMQMRTLMTAWDPHGLTQVKGSALTEDKVDGIIKKNDMSAVGGNGDMSGMSGIDTAGNKKYAKPVINAGTVSYAQLLTEANSDTQGPILAQILSGPLKGARAVGSFKVSNEYLVMSFSLANLNGIDYKIDALALDPDTTLGGMATEVDERYFTRVLLPAAASFMQGIGSALSNPGSSIVTNGTTTIVQQSSQGFTQGMYQGLAAAGQTVGQFFETQANQTKPLVRVAAGTPIGLFFVNTVCSGQGCSLDIDQQAKMTSYPNGYPNNRYPGYPNPTYPGAQPAGYGYGGQSGYYNNGGPPSGTGITATPATPDNSPNPYNPAMQSPPINRTTMLPGYGGGYGSPVMNP